MKVCSMASTGANKSGRRSTRQTKASLDAVESIILSADSTNSKKTVTKAKKRGKTSQTKTIHNSKKKRTVNTAPATLVSTEPAANISEPVGGTDGNSDVRGLIQETCMQLIPEIVNNVLNQRRPQDGQNVESDTSSESDDEEEEEADLRAEALASRVARSRSTPAQYTPPQPADLLPALDPKIIRKIKKGEYVELSLCLPTLSPQPKTPVATPVINSDGHPAWQLESSVARGKNREFSDWMVAWNAYSRCASHFFPSMAGQFLFYQSQITDLSRLYTIGSVLAYDQAFRTRVANGEVLRWDYHDNELRAAHLVLLPPKMKSAPTRSDLSCWSCHQLGHVATNCPTRRSNNTPRNSRHPGDATSSPPPFLAPHQPNATNNTQPTRSAAIPPQKPPVRDECHFWNTARGCTYKQCRFEHRCEICKSPQHSRLLCPIRHEP